MRDLLLTLWTMPGEDFALGLILAAVWAHVVWGVRLWRNKR